MLERRRSDRGNGSSSSSRSSKSSNWMFSRPVLATGHPEDAACEKLRPCGVYLPTVWEECGTGTGRVRNGNGAHGDWKGNTSRKRAVMNCCRYPDTKYIMGPATIIDNQVRRKSVSLTTSPASNRCTHSAKRCTTQAKAPHLLFC